MYTVLVNDVVKKYILQQPPPARRRLRDKFEFLENGIWDGGLLVKKVRGPAERSIFEARLDAGLRILFTLGREPGRDTEPRRLVYVWGIVDHDALNRKIQAILPDHVPFLRFTPYQEAELGDVELDALAAEDFSQESIEERLADDSRSQHWYPLDETEWARLRAYSQGEFDLRLHLTAEQQAILEMPLPVLLSGTAGSGKTTLAVYYLLHPFLRSRRTLFVTYNHFLKLYAERLFQGLIRERPQPADARSPEFFTYRDLCLELTTRAKGRFEAEREATFARFQRQFADKGPAGRYDAALLWEEFRSILKGAVAPMHLPVLRRFLPELERGRPGEAAVRELQDQFLALAGLESGQVAERFARKYLDCDLETFATRLPRHVQAHPDRVARVVAQTLEHLDKHRSQAEKRSLSFYEYELLGRKRAPNFRFNRREIFDLFEGYQRWLEAEGLWDELDLARAAAAFLQAHPDRTPLYDAVVCDEIQDLTDLQHRLLFALARNPLQLFLAGDTKQVINPSGFRWEEVRRHFHQRGLAVPELRILRLNFRSSGSVVELANMLLNLKEQWLGVSAEQVREDWKFKGRPPLVLHGLDEPAMVGQLRRTGADRAILVREEAERERLKAALGTEFVFTIAEAKGLEFHTVVLWKFAADSLVCDVWRAILDESARRVHEARIRHEINLLYVGVTRARNDLVIYDGSDSSILWNSPELGDLVFRTDDADFLNQLWNVISSPEEWRRQGEYFFDREFFRAAMECFKNGGDDARHALAAARYAEQQDRPAEAAAHFERAGRWADAGRNYERAGDARRALATWERAGDRERIRACRAAVLEADGDWSGAADLFLEQGESERAVHCLVQAQRFEEAAALCEKPLKQPAKAAMYYEKAGRLEPAVRLLLRLKQYARAAEFEERLGRLAEAERDWRRGGDPEQLIRFYERTDQSRKLLAIYERARDLDKAVRCLRGVKDRPALLREAGALFEAKKYFPALVRFTVLDQRAEIGRCLLALKRYDEAAVVLRETGQFEQAGVAYRRLGQFRESVECFLQSDEDRRAGFTAARQALRRVWDNEWFSGQIGHHLRGRQFEQAAVFFDVGGDPASAGVCLARAGRIEEAHALWGKCRSLAEFNTSAGLAAGMETSGPLAEYLLSLPLDGLQDAWERFVQSDSVIEMMERYLTHPVREAPIRNWLERLDAWVGYGTHWEHRLVMWESIGDYDALVLLAEIQLRYLLFTERDLRFRFQEDLRKMGLGGSPEARAIRHWFLGETAAFEELCGRIEPRPGLLLLLGKSARYPEAVARLEADGEWIQAAGILSEHRRFEEAGRLYEAAGDLFAAAQAYAAAGQPGRSGPLLEKAGLWLQAAEHYFTAGEYARAIEMFNREKKPKLRRIAAAYERMKDFPNALRIWEQLGDRKNYQRCLRKSGRDTLF